MGKKRVMIVEDSPTIRRFLRDVIDADSELMVVAECESAEQALAKLSTALPNVISMDIQLPRMSGLEATRRIMETHPTPIVIVSQSVSTEDIASTMDALRAGAVSAVEAPSLERAHSLAGYGARIRRELAVMSQVKVVRQRFNQTRTRPPKRMHAAAELNHPIMNGAKHRPTLLGIVASTGGPRAVEIVLRSLGADFPIPIVLVQHMTTSFHAGFVSWLDRISPQRVVEACEGARPVAGVVYVAPADKHVILRRQRLAIDTGPPVSGQCPSGTVLLRSMAEELGPCAAGVVLTGMGDDGAEGLLAIGHAGGLTIAEDETTAIVNGMPAAARSLDASCISLRLESIGLALRNAAPTSQKVYR
jgi:two-component system, chemotaxis family, protein-glutamate methylesterase/glutaminase